VRWICPRCGVSLSLALTECPYCPPASKPAEAPPAAAPVHGEPVQGEPVEPAAISRPPAAAGPPVPEESLYLRGARFAVGFLLAVVTILLLLALLLEWLAAHPEWQPWLGPPGR